MPYFLSALTATPLRLGFLRFASCIVVSGCASIFLDRARYGDFGGMVAFLLIAAVSWLTGPGPASLASLSLMLAARAQAKGFQTIGWGYTSQEITNLVVFTIIMITVGWAGKIRRKSINEVRQRERQLREQAIRKDQFLATLAHELRNPLAPLKNGLELLQHFSGPQYDAAMFAEAHGIMTRQLNHMVRLVDDLLDMSRINTGKITLQLGAVSIDELMEDAVQFARPHLDAAGHQLTVSKPPRPCQVQGDRARLIQVLSNLLNNAAKFTPAGGQISFKAEFSEQRVILRICDSGIGLSSDSIERVFEMFAQVDHGSTRVQSGLGIGLNLARRLIEMHGGTIEARSEGLGKGSQFIVQLPVG